MKSCNQKNASGRGRKKWGNSDGIEIIAGGAEA